MSTRRLAAIMFTDIAGYTAMMQEDEARAVTLRKRHREVFEREHEAHRGTIVQYYGDGTLSVFDSAVDAAACAVKMQQTFQQEEPKVPLRIGIHTGDILLSETEVIGDGVNVASRVESMAEIGSVLVSETVYDNLKNQSGFPGESMGIFTFKNVAKPLEVFALTSEGLQVPNPKKLSGKFLKRQSAKPNLFQRLPIWAQYAVGLVAFLVLAPFIYSPITSLFDANAINTATGPNGELLSRDAIAFQDKKRIVQTPFTLTEADSSLKWAEVMVPTIISMDWEQDPYMYDVFEPFQAASTFKEYAEMARENQCDWVMEGEIKQTDSAYHIRVSLTNLKDNTAYQELEAEGKDLLPLLDKVSVDVKRAIGVPQAHLRQVTDLPISQFLTESEEAVKAFGSAYSTIPTNPILGFVMMKEPINEDSTFAWAAYNLATFIRAYQMSETKAKEYIDLAMRHRSRLPDVFELRVRQLHYRLNGEPEKALELNRLFVELEPDNPKHLKALIEESFAQRDYTATLEGIEQYRQFEGQALSYFTQKAACLLALGRAEEALQAAEAYLAQNPNQEKGILAKGESLIYMEEWEDALNVFKQAELLFPDNKVFPKFIQHIEAEQAGKGLSMAQKEEMTGRYSPYHQMSYRAPITLNDAHILLDLERIPAIRMYYSGEGLEIFSDSDQRIVFDADSTGKIYRITFHNDKYDVRTQHYKIEGAFLEVVEGLQAHDFERVASNLAAAQEQKPDLPYLDGLAKHLEQRAADALPDSMAREAYVGNYVYENQTLIIRNTSTHLTFSQSAIEWAADPAPLLYQEKDIFLFDEIFIYPLQFERKGSKVTGLRIQPYGREAMPIFQKVD